MAPSKRLTRKQELAGATKRIAVLPPPVFLEGEDAAVYNRLLEQVSAAVAPRDIIEEFWVRDVVDLLWEAIRLRRLKSSLLVLHARSGLEAVIQPLVGYDESRKLSALWNARLPDAVKKVTELLAGADLSMDEVMAQTLSLKIKDVERIERMIADAEARRASVLREIDRHRAALAASLRAAAESIEDAEFAEVTAPDKQPEAA